MQGWHAYVNATSILLACYGAGMAFLLYVLLNFTREAAKTRRRRS